MVGWYEPLECEPIMSRTTIITFESLSQEIPSSGFYVPYVSDFGGAQQPVPRPFYCTRRFPGTPFTGFVPHNWYFYTFLSTDPINGTSSVNITASEIYVDPTWEWGN